MGMETPEELEALGERLALLQQPRPPKGVGEALRFGSVLLDVLKAKPDLDLIPPCHQEVFKGEAVNLDALPLLRPWPVRCGPDHHLGARDHQGPGNGDAQCRRLSPATADDQHHDRALAERSWWGSAFAQGRGPQVNPWRSRLRLGSTLFW